MTWLASPQGSTGFNKQLKIPWLWCRRQGFSPRISPPPGPSDGPGWPSELYVCVCVCVCLCERECISMYCVYHVLGWQDTCVSDILTPEREEQHQGSNACSTWTLLTSIFTISQFTLPEALYQICIPYIHNPLWQIRKVYIVHAVHIN